MITLGHGAGGKLTHKLIKEHFLCAFDNDILSRMEDSAVIGELAFTTDCYVVTPRFFPGGDLGTLAVSGTVNDLSMAGAEPLYLSAGFILEEGLALDELDRLIDSMAGTAKEAGVKIATGDTKVVPKGAADGVFITTAGIGRLDDFRPDFTKAAPTDLVIVSGTIADHGMAVMASRETLALKAEIKSDAAPLWSLVKALKEGGVEVKTLRDPTRGGVAQSLVEVAEASKTRIVLDDEAIPVKRPVRGLCELLGIDPVHVANEGKLIAIVKNADAQKALNLLKEQPLGKDAAIIGRVEEGDGQLELLTAAGVRRPVRMPVGEVLPRIC